MRMKHLDKDVTNPWYHCDDSPDDESKGAHYSAMGLKRAADPMATLKLMFPTGEANEMNLCLFSTSGVHGTYNTIEESERALRGEKDKDGEDLCIGVTFLIVQPRLVCVRYGEVDPKNQEEIDYLKNLRASSHREFAKIGIDQKEPKP